MCREVLIRYPYEIFEHVTLTINIILRVIHMHLPERARVKDVMQIEQPLFQGISLNPPHYSKSENIVGVKKSPQF